MRAVNARFSSILRQLPEMKHGNGFLWEQVEVEAVLNSMAV